MKIVSVRAENFKRLKLVELTPQGAVTRLTGKNRQGKSSTLDAIAVAIGGHAAEKLTQTTNPIREGEERAEVTVELDEYTITRTWTQTNSYLTVRSKDGTKLNSPQKLLDAMFNGLSFDPLAFMSMEPKKQMETLQRISGYDPSELDEQRKRLYDERTMVNREMKQAAAKAEALLAGVPEDVPDEEVSLSSLMSEFQEAQRVRDENRKKREQLDALRATRQRKAQEKKDLEERIADLARQLEEAEGALQVVLDEELQIIAEGTALRAEVDFLVDPDMDAISEQMGRVEEINAGVRTRREWLAAVAEEGRVSAKSTALTGHIAEIDKRKEEMLKAAALPIEGLAFGEDGIIYEGQPLGQASHADKIRVSLAMGMAMNPDLKVMLIKDGEKFDSGTWAMVEEMVAEKDYQVFVEQMDESGEIGIYIEDGMVKGNE